MDVWISIHGRQTAADTQEEDSMELMTEGKLLRDDLGFRLTYTEKDSEGLGETETTLLREAETGRVTLLRAGDVTTQMVFEPGRKHVSCYETPFGSMMVGVLTQHLECTGAPSEGNMNIEMEYSMEIDNALVGKNTLRIEVRESGAPLPLRPLSYLQGDRFAH